MINISHKLSSWLSLHRAMVLTRKYMVLLLPFLLCVRCVVEWCLCSFCTLVLSLASDPNIFFSSSNHLVREWKVKQHPFIFFFVSFSLDVFLIVLWFMKRIFNGSSVNRWCTWTNFRPIKTIWWLDIRNTILYILHTVWLGVLWAGTETHNENNLTASTSFADRMEISTSFR